MKQNEGKVAHKNITLRNDFIILINSFLIKKDRRKEKERARWIIALSLSF